MNLQNLSDQSLLSATAQLVREERELLTKILYHLHEIERRKLYCDAGFRSLFDFAVRSLGYSEDQAWRRIAAMKLLRELPQLEEKINSGDLSLSHLGMAHAAFRQEAKLLDQPVPAERKLSLITQIAAKPIREAERVTAKWSSSPVERVPDQVRFLGGVSDVGGASEMGGASDIGGELEVGAARLVLRFEAPLEVREKLVTLRGYLAHEAPDLSLGELLNRLCDLGLQHWRPSVKAHAGGTRGTTATSRESRVNQLRPAGEDSLKVRGNSAASRVSLIRQIFAEAKDCCQNCGSTYALEIDHIHPRAWGGGTERENLRVLCRNCNQRAAVKIFGARVSEQKR